MCAARVARSTVANFIKSKIMLSGPIPVADYMKLALTAQPGSANLLGNENKEAGGYYMKKDVFGARGDFITSPEISQLFGEMLAVWSLQTWMEMGGPRKFSIVELGPGRGTLAKDILRVFKQFPHITGNNVSLHLVEISPFLATLQYATLTKNEGKQQDESSMMLDPMKGGEKGEPSYHSATASETGFPVFWYRDINSVPQDFHLYIAHEFFDALPVHKLQRVGSEWRELLIDVNPEEESSFRFVISRNETPVIKLLQERYPGLLRNETREHIEVSLESLSILENLTNRLNKNGGIAKIIDYGHEGTKEDTFRAFYQHALADPLSDPGKADITYDVDFSVIQKLFGERVKICGSVPQNEFLKEIGIEARLQALVQKCTSPKENLDLTSGYNMIMNDMGSRFRMLTLLPNILKTRMPNMKVAGYG